MNSKTFTSKADIRNDLFETMAKLTRVNYLDPLNSWFLSPRRLHEEGLLLPFITNQEVRDKLVEPVKMTELDKQNHPKKMTAENMLSFMPDDQFLPNVLLKISNLVDVPESAKGKMLRSIWFDIMKVMCRELGESQCEIGKYPDFMALPGWCPFSHMAVDDFLNWNRYNQLIILIPLIYDNLSNQAIDEAFEPDEAYMALYFSKMYNYGLFCREQITENWNLND